MVRTRRHPGSPSPPQSPSPNAAKRFYWGKYRTTEFCKLCVQMIQKGDIERRQQYLNDEDAESLSRGLNAPLKQKIPIKKIKDKWINLMQLYDMYFNYKNMHVYAGCRAIKQHKRKTKHSMNPIKKVIYKRPANMKLLKIMFHTEALAKVLESPTPSSNDNSRSTCEGDSPEPTPPSSYDNSRPTFQRDEDAALSPEPTPLSSYDNSRPTFQRDEDAALSPEPTPLSSYDNSRPTFQRDEDAALSPEPTLGDNLHPSTLPPVTSVHLEMSSRIDDEDVEVMDVHPCARTAAKEGDIAQTRAEHEAEATAVSGVNIDQIMFREEGSSSGPDRMAPILRGTGTGKEGKDQTFQCNSEDSAWADKGDLFSSSIQKPCPTPNGVEESPPLSSKRTAPECETCGRPNLEFNSDKEIMKQILEAVEALHTKVNQNTLEVNQNTLALERIDRQISASLNGNAASSADIFQSQAVVSLTCTEIENLLRLESRSEPWLVVLYAPWCPFCRAMEASYVELAEKLAGTGVKVAKFRADGEQLPFAQAELQLSSFPTVLLFPSCTARPIKYSNEKRDVDSLLAFVNSLR